MYKCSGINWSLVLNTNFKDKEIKLTKLKNYSGFINTAQFRFFNLLKNKYSITN